MILVNLILSKRDLRRRYNTVYLRNRHAEKRPEDIAARKKHYAKNREYYIAKFRKYYHLNKARFAARNRRLKYGLSEEGYAALVAATGGRCEICELPPRGKSCLHVDHDHKTGKVRGLLCVGCNARVGHLESPLMEKSLIYIRKHAGGGR